MTDSFGRHTLNWRPEGLILICCNAEAHLIKRECSDGNLYDPWPGEFVFECCPACEEVLAGYIPAKPEDYATETT